MKHHFVYIVRCADNSLYTGYSTDVLKRVDTHNKGKGAKYTQGRLPVKLEYFEEYPTISEALKREYKIKKLSKEDKERLIQVKTQMLP